MGAAEALAGEQAAQEGGAFRAALAHVEVGVGAVADEGVDERDVGVGHVGVEVAGADEGQLAEFGADEGLQGAFGVVEGGGQAGAVEDGVDAVHVSAQGAEAVAPLVHHGLEQGVVHRAVRLGHGEHEGARLPGAGGVHGGNEAGHFAQRLGGRAAGVGDDGLAAQPAALGEILRRGDGGEAVALDGETEQGHARARAGKRLGVHASTPSSSA
jgi:hypothetical protein